MHENLEEQLVKKIIWAWHEGCPVATNDVVYAKKQAEFSRRRWASFERRRRKTKLPNTLDTRIKDLAKGLANEFTQGGREMVGPLIQDYTWLAEQIAPILDA